ncbi:hypothetical protein I545_6152 [Mycobacterium kansasii 662]|uniref:Uncharacterized protein n=2 Tax=Mycobacterium kansasii TaxID=1768 RepID=A0A1V3X2S5_MYCKA|nr:hypothetical protein I545_6152 [Mycobacterium kansasii 662]OOK73382.1 hypothetical protein BZL30_4752 [Mycobacterium kansasii]
MRGHDRGRDRLEIQRSAGPVARLLPQTPVQLRCTIVQF